jgi:hypothetical protein
VGRRLTLEWERLELSQFSRGPKDEVSRTDVKKPERRQYLKNAYRVLLTRARQGMVIFVPPGAKRDRTRNFGFYELFIRQCSEQSLPMKPFAPFSRSSASSRHIARACPGPWRY